MKTRLSTKLVLLGLAGAFTLFLASGVCAQPGEFVKGVLQPLADGFPKQALTMIVVDDPGTPDAIIAATFQEALKPISPVPLLVSTEPSPSWGTFYTIRDTLTRKGGDEGYYPIIGTVWGTATDLLVNPITEETGLGLNDLNVVIVFEKNPYVIFQKKNPPWGPSWPDLVKYGKANPGKLRYISNEVGSGTDIAVEYILQGSGVKVQKIVQGSATQCLQTVGAGQGDLSLAAMARLMPHWEKGVIEVVMILGSYVPPPWNKNPNVTSSVAQGFPPWLFGNPNGFFVPKQVPKEHVEWLFKLFKAGASTPIFKKREETNPGLLVEVMTTAEANQLKQQLYDGAEPIVRAMGMLWEQQKKK